ncbi:MAG: phosphate/phosphite/phosphonate ABC transporter substrate-binding protein, partial [Gammaproteobacteria bacterium]|nr:phosphate/phosphite/phosphonate ABC transporter substrate-binding protein [Gammaproteobacteria bacterium]
MTLGPGRAVVAEELVFGLHPFLPPAELINRFAPLMEYLSVATGLPIRIEIVKDYRTHILAVGEDRRDIAYLGPVSYVRTVQSYGPKPILAQLEVNGENSYLGVIVVRRDSTLKSLSDLGEKRFAFGDPDSTMGYLVPRYMLLKAGIDGDELGGSEHLKNHKSVAMAVLAGMFDAGAIKESVYRRFEEQGLRVLAWTPPIATHLFVARANLPQPTLHTLREAFVRLGSEPDGPAILRTIKPAVSGLRPG